MADEFKEEERVRIGVLVKDGNNHYYREKYGVVVNVTKGTEEEIWSNDPEVFWNLTKEQFLARVEAPLKPTGDAVNLALATVDKILTPKEKATWISDKVTERQAELEKELIAEPVKEVIADEPIVKE